MQTGGRSQVHRKDQGSLSRGFTNARNEGFKISISTGNSSEILMYSGGCIYILAYRLIVSRAQDKGLAYVSQVIFQEVRQETKTPQKFKNVQVDYR